MTTAAQITEECYRIMMEDALMWSKAGYPAVAIGRYRDAAETIRLLLGEVTRLREALRIIAEGTICPELFPGETNEDALAAKTAMVSAIAALEPRP
jgi:hypothetical protein